MVQNDVFRDGASSWNRSEISTVHLREVEMNSELKHTLVKCTQNVLPNVSLSIELIRTLIQDIEKDSKI